MNKLLQRLPDSSREEVRNQAIVLIQQLTSTNEEMKKTVVFNEVILTVVDAIIIVAHLCFKKGFDILFGIIHSEGGAADAGVVIQDCLQICNNILHDSETCQRLFFGMGVHLILKLSDFFDPSILGIRIPNPILSDSYPRYNLTLELNFIKNCLRKKSVNHWD